MCSVACVVVFPLQVRAQGRLQITFDGPPVLSPGSGTIVQSYSESGMYFTSLGSGFTRMAAGRTTRPDDGTAYLTAALGESLSFSRLDGGAFDLLSVDLAEYSTALPDAVTVQFIGYFGDGSTVPISVTTDGIIDGTGALVDFQTFTFRGWTGLTRVEIPTSGWSLDNLVVGVPEPTSGALLFVSGGILWFLRSRQNCKAK